MEEENTGTEAQEQPSLVDQLKQGFKDVLNQTGESKEDILSSLAMDDDDVATPDAVPSSAAPEEIDTLRQELERYKSENRRSKSVTLVQRAKEQNPDVEFNQEVLDGLLARGATENQIKRELNRDVHANRAQRAKIQAEVEKGLEAKAKEMADKIQGAWGGLPPSAGPGKGPDGGMTLDAWKNLPAEQRYSNEAADRLIASAPTPTTLGEMAKRKK